MVSPCKNCHPDPQVVLLRGLRRRDLLFASRQQGRPSQPDPSPLKALIFLLYLLYFRYLCFPQRYLFFLRKHGKLSSSPFPANSCIGPDILNGVARYVSRCRFRSKCAAKCPKAKPLT